MKKLIAYLSILLFAAQAQAQQTNYYLSPVKIDSLVSVSLPKDPVKQSATGETAWSVKGTYGSMIVIRSVNPVTKTDVKNPKGLDNVFKDYVKKVQLSLTQGNIVNDHDTTIGKLTARDFTLRVDTGSGSQSRHFTLVYTKDVTYTFEYLYEDYRAYLAMDELKAFTKSITISPELTTADQYIISAGHFPTVTVILGAVALFAIIGLVLFFIRRPRLAV